MTFTYRVAPLGPWPDATPDHARQISRFSATWSDTLDVLDRELHQLAAKNVVMQLDVTDRDIRNDGQVRAGARIDFPGVRISFDSKHGPLTYSTDVFSYASTWRSGLGLVWHLFRREVTP